MNPPGSGLTAADMRCTNLTLDTEARSQIDQKMVAEQGSSLEVALTLNWFNVQK